jgi:L-iditol 2-dehydrogenase
LNIFPGQSVVVVGLGVAGQLHLQLVKARGASPVIGVTRNAWKGKLAKDLGADVTLSGGTDAVHGVLECTGGNGADVVIVCTGALPAIADAISMCRPGATLSLFGISTTANYGLPYYMLYLKELKIFNSRAATAQDFPAAIDLVARGVVNLERLVTHRVGLAQLSSAIHLLEGDGDHRMKVVVEHY